MEVAVNSGTGTTSTGSGTPASKRRRSNVGKACLNCRRRKAKCDGIAPRCKTCETYNDECRWADDLDGRKPASRQYVHSLKARVKTLESLLLAQGQTLPGEEGEEDDGSKSDGEEGLDSATQTMLHIHIADGAQDLQVHGPTSAFAHTVPARAGGPSQSPVSRPAHMDTSLENEMLDYRRFLPPSVDLSADQHALVLDRFFMFFSSWGMRAHPIAFYRDMESILSSPHIGPPSRSAQYSPFLHNIVLSIGLKFADEPYLRDAKTRELFALKALSFLNEELERPTLATVLALAIKSSYHSTMDEHTAGWTWFGLADRAAQTMGLNIDCEPLVEAGKMTAEEMKRRLHAFWSVFIQNQTWAVYIGRANPELQYTTRIPGVNPAIDAVPFRFETLPEGFPRDPQQPSMLSTTFVETAKLSEIMQRIMQALYSIKSNAARLHRDNSVSELGLALDTWTEQLPAALVLTGHSLKNALPHILMLQMAREWANILIYRPYYRSIVGTSRAGEKKESISVTAVKRCDRSAARIVSLLRIWHDRFGLAFSPPTILSIAFTAGTTHLLAAVHHRSPKLREEAIGSAKECIHLLRLVAVSWPAAGHKADILASLVSEYDPPSPPQPVVPAQDTGGSSAYLGNDNAIDTQQYQATSVPDQETMSDTSFWANPPDWLNMTSLAAPAPSQEPSDWFALMVQPSGSTDTLGASMPSINSTLPVPPQHISSPGEEAFLRSLFNMSGETSATNPEPGPSATQLYPATVPTGARQTHDSALSLSPEDRFTSSAWSSHQPLSEHRSSSFGSAPDPTRAPQPPQPTATFASEPAAFPYDMGSFIAGLRAAWEAEQATKRMMAQRSSPATTGAPGPAPAPPGTTGPSAWGRYPPPPHPDQPYQ